MDNNASHHLPSNGRVVCRYFSTKGECYYGSDCQYLHQSGRSESGAESKLSRWLPPDSGTNGQEHPKSQTSKFTPRLPFQPMSGFSAPRSGFRGQGSPITQLPHPPVSFFVADETRLQLLQRQALVHALPDPVLFPDIPPRVDSYQDLCPLEPAPGQPSQSLRLVTSVFKATDHLTGDVLCLHRVHDFTPTGHMKGTSCCS